MARSQHALVRRVFDLCRAHGLLVATAESCTGGLVAGALTEIAGSSDVVDCGFVTYSNSAKQRLLGVSAATLNRHGLTNITSAEQAALALEPLAGKYASVLFAIGFMFYVAITVFPLAGMPAPPLQPFGPAGSLLLWLAIACASGGLLALLGALVVAVSASEDDQA